MALSLSNNFEGGTDGTTITTANSGGTSGNAFDVVTISGTTTVTFDSTNPAHGAGLGMKVVPGSATPNQGYVVWTTSLGTLSTNQTLFGRMYLLMSAFGSLAVPLLLIRGAGVQNVELVMSTTGTLRFHDGANVNAGTVSGTLSTNTLYRLEFQVTGLGGGTGAGSGQVNVYLGDSTSATDTACAMSAVTLGTTAPDEVRVGLAASGASGTNSYYFDALNINDSGYPGPEVVALPSGGLVNSTRRLRTQYR